MSSASPAHPSVLLRVRGALALACLGLRLVGGEDVAPVAGDAQVSRSVGGMPSSATCACGWCTTCRRGGAEPPVALSHAPPSQAGGRMPRPATCRWSVSGTRRRRCHSQAGWLSHAELSHQSVPLRRTAAQAVACAGLRPVGAQARNGRSGCSIPRPATSRCAYESRHGWLSHEQAGDQWVRLRRTAERDVAYSAVRHVAGDARNRFAGCRMLVGGTRRCTRAGQHD